MASRCSNKVSCHCCIHCDCKYKIQLKELPSMNPSSTTSVSDRNRCCKQNLKTLHCSKNNKRQQPEIYKNHFYKNKLPGIATVRRVNNFQNVSKLCCCATELTIGDLLASSKINKNMNTENIVNKHNLNKLSENSIRCGRCDLKKKKQELANSENSSSWIIMETLNLMQKIVDERRQARLKFGNSFSKNNCNETIIKQDQKVVSLNDNYMNYDTDCIKKSHPCLKYSLIVTTNSNCNVSTQTTSSTAIDTSKPQLLKILSEIQDYAQNIQEYFEELNNYKEETCKAAQKSNREHFQQFQNSKESSGKNLESNEEYSQEAKNSINASNYKNTKQRKAKHDSQRICEQGSSSDSEHKKASQSCGCEETPKRRPVSAQTDENSDLESLPEEYISRLSDGVEEDDSRFSIQFTSTPRGSRDLNTNAQIKNLSRFSLDSDLDSTEYMKLPKQIETSANERRVTCTDDNLDTVQYQRKMKTIQEKIERLRHDLLSDNNNDGEKEDIK